MDQSTDRLWRSAQNQMSAGNVMAAAQTLHALLERDPRHAAAHMTLGHIARSRARISASRAACGREPAVGFSRCHLDIVAGLVCRGFAARFSNFRDAGCGLCLQLRLERGCAISNASGCTDSREPSSAPQLPCVGSCATVIAPLESGSLERNRLSGRPRRWVVGETCA